MSHHRTHPQLAVDAHKVEASYPSQMDECSRADQPVGDEDAGERAAGYDDRVTPQPGPQGERLREAARRVPLGLGPDHAVTGRDWSTYSRSPSNANSTS